MKPEMTLFRAITEGDLARVRDLIDGNPSLVSARDAGGATPLHWAAWHGNREMIELLTGVGADVNAYDRQYGATPAAWATEAFRRKGGFLTTEIDDLLFAIQRQEIDWVGRFLSRMPALANCRDASGKPLREYAEESGNRDLIALFAQRQN